MIRSRPLGAAIALSLFCFSHAPAGAEPTLEDLLQPLESLEAQVEDLPFLLNNLASASQESSEPDPRQVEHFETQVRPVLMETCFKCHGGDKVSAGLRVDSLESLLAGGQSGPALAPGDSTQSLLLRALRHEEDAPHMPPTGKLPEETIAAFDQWIAQGAGWPRGADYSPEEKGKSHWAFQPMKKVDPPFSPTGWSVHPIDRFIETKLAEKSLSPNPRAEKETLLRRVTFDLVGLPPTPEEIEAFIEDESPQAWEKTIDRLLASPRYGERWGRHWMDVARYADTAGDSADYPVPELRFYRDYIIDSFNKDKPFNQFVCEQIAGDLMSEGLTGEEYAEKIIATGFIALSRRFGTVPYQTMHEVHEDTIDTVGRAFMGLTLKCARCHDHKFDPISIEDYYGMYGFFESTQYPFAGAELTISQNKPRAHFIPIEPPAQVEDRLRPFEERVKQYEAVIEYIEKESPAVRRIAELEKQIASLEQVLPSATPELHAQTLRELLEGFQKEKSQAEKEQERELTKKQKELGAFHKAGLPENVTGAYAVRDGVPIDSRLQKRGEPGDLGDVIPRNVPSILRAEETLQIPEGTSGRLQLAQWLVRPDHPLTARVLVNRLWHHHFGKGLVASTSNFGLMGDEPTHPDLLDWLAVTFIEKGWSIKALHRLILTSETYRQSSDHEDAKGKADPTNKLLWKYDRRRLDAEAIRDSLLAVSGKLDLSRPGRHPFPPIEKWRYTQHDPFRDIYPSYHRSVYLMVPRIQRHPFLALFDGPDPNRTTGERSESNVPLQALYVLNNPLVEECVVQFGQSLAAPDRGREEAICHAVLLAWGRAARDSEALAFKQYLAGYEQEAMAEGISVEESETKAWQSLARILLSANEFVYLD